MGKSKPKATGKIDSATTTSTSTAAAAAAAAAQNDTPPAPSSVFETIFGGVDGNSAVSSIFSDTNPFKRKPQEESTEKPENVDHLKKRKNLKQDGMEGGEDKTALVLPKKTKKVQTLNPNEGAESKEESPKVGLEIAEMEGRRKKRKRDEVEAEYEAKKYGLVPENADKAAAVAVGKKRKKTDDAADLLVSKEPEGFDDEKKLLRTVFVGNLPLKVKKKALIKEFSKFGDIESVRIRSVPILETKKPRKGAIMSKKIDAAADSVHAYIVFNTEQSAEASLAHNMAVVEGNHVRVDRACPPRKKLKGENALLYDNKRTVFVGNLPYDVKDEELYQLFSSIEGLKSGIEAVRAVRDAQLGRGRGIAYVLFKTREDATFVVKKRNLKLRDRELRLSRAIQEPTVSKRKNPMSGGTDGPPSKKLAVDSRTPDHKGGSSTKAAASYQGLRASKSGTEKKIQSFRHPKQRADGVVKMKLKSKAKKVDKNSGKRPAVAARKARANALLEAGALKPAGQKRKLDSRTPGSSNRKKKARKFS